MFIPETIERKKVKPTKYSEFVDEENVREKVGIFGKKKKSTKSEDAASKVA